MENTGKALAEKWWSNTMAEFTRLELNKIIDYLWHENLGKAAEIADLKRQKNKN